MAINLTKRANGGFTLVYDGVTCYPSELKYYGSDTGIILFAPGLKVPRFYPPADWTIQTATGYTTVTQVADALDAQGVASGDVFDDMKVLLGTIDADTSDIKTAIELIDNSVDGAALNVNMNVNGTDVAANSGNRNDQTLRVVIATDQPALTNRLLTTEQNSATINTSLTSGAQKTQVVAGSNTVSLQVPNFGAVTDLETDNFSLPDDAPFVIKNDNDEPVTLEVIPAGGSAFVETVMAVGWNPEIVKEIKTTAGGGSLLWGY